MHYKHAYNLINPGYSMSYRYLNLLIVILIANLSVDWNCVWAGQNPSESPFGHSMRAFRNKNVQGMHRAERYVLQHYYCAGLLNSIGSLEFARAQGLLSIASSFDDLPQTFLHELYGLVYIKQIDISSGTAEVVFDHAFLYTHSTVGRK